MNNFIDDDQDIPAVAAIGSFRDALPTHFTFKIQSFSLLTTSYSMVQFESNEFEAGGYKWRLVFYPKGNNITTTTTTTTTSTSPTNLQNGGSGSSSESPHYVSMFLKIVGTESLPRGWALDASFRFFVLDQIRDKYLILGDMGGKTRRFHGMKTMWGYDQLLTVTILNDSSNGFLVDDTCVFGAEVFPCKSTGCGDCLTMVKSPSCVKFTWKIEKISSKKEQFIYSDVFIVNEYKWKIMIYPKGDSRANKENISLFLCMDGLAMNTLVDATGAASYQVYVNYKLRVRDQVHNFHKETHFASAWFKQVSPSVVGWGSPKFMRLDELNDESKGYLVNDICIVEAEITVLGALKNLS